MNVYKMIAKGLTEILFVIAGLFSFAQLAYGLEQLPAVKNDISEAVLNQTDKTVTVSGSLIMDLGYTGQLYAVLDMQTEQYAPIDQVVAKDAIRINPGVDHLDYKVTFDLNVLPTATDQIAMVWRSENSIPLDIDPVVWAEGTTFATTTNQESYHIQQCHFDQDIELIFCSYTGKAPSQLNVTWYKDNIYEGKEISSNLLKVKVTDQDLVMKSQALPSEDGLYMFLIRDPDGRQVHLGSSRVGKLIIQGPQQEVQNTATAQSEQAQQDMFVTQLIVLVIGFIGLILLAGVILLGENKTKYIYAALIAILLGGLGFWYQAQAAVYQSTDYAQYTYTVSTTPKGGDEYWVSFAALDTNTGTPPVNQHVQVTIDGTSYSDLILDNTGAASHQRSITVPASASTTAAIQVKDGCASYWGHSDFADAVFGDHDCEPIPLFNPNGVVNPDPRIGCMDSTADNYDPAAIIESGTCNCGAAYSLPDNFGEACMSNPNECSFSNVGTIGCGGVCNALKPSEIDAKGEKYFLEHQGQVYLYENTRFSGSDIANKCYSITNTAGKGLFIPMKTLSELENFIEADTFSGESNIDIVPMGQ